MDGDMGCFTRVHNERLITSFAQLRVPRDNLNAPTLPKSWPILSAPSEYRFTHGLALGTTWFKAASEKIRGVKLEYPRFQCHPDKHCFVSSKYSHNFISEASDYLIEWAENFDLREALLTTAEIPNGQSYPFNSFAFITAHAILGNIDELENLKGLVLGNLERPIVSKVKVNHIDNAIECCNHPGKYDLSPTLINNLRGN